MARKVFWILWVTVWPAVAIIPPLINAQSPGLKIDQATDRTADFPDDQLPPRPDSNDATAGPTEIVGESLVPSESPLRTVSQPQPVEELPPVPTQTLDLTDPAAPSTDKLAETSKPAADVLPSRTGRSRTTPPGFPSGFPRQSGTTARLNQATGPMLTAQEEQAQKIIHERAALRGVQRQLRLEAKYRGRNPQYAPVQTTRWQPQLTETNWVAGSRAGVQP